MMPDEEGEYITLFCEGDGHVRITPAGRPKVVFAQKERNVLDYVDSLTESGHIYPRKDGVLELVFNASGERLRTSLPFLVDVSIGERWLDL